MNVWSVPLAAKDEQQWPLPGPSPVVGSICPTPSEHPLFVNSSGGQQHGRKSQFFVRAVAWVTANIYLQEL